MLQKDFFEPYQEPVLSWKKVRFVTEFLKRALLLIAFDLTVKQ